MEDNQSKQPKRSKVKVRADKYDAKLAINSDFESLIKLLVKEDTKKK